MKKVSGFTLVEMLITAGMAGALLAVCAMYLPRIQTYFRRLQLAQQLQSESATAMDTMNRILRQGKASTVAICSCSNSACASPACDPAIGVPPPNSQIVFQTQDGTWHRFWWETQQLMMADGPTNVSFPNQHALTRKDVGSVVFTGDFRDLSIVNVSLFMSAPLDASGDASHVVTVILPTQSVRMLTAS